MESMVEVQVRGPTRKFRDVLRNTYDLRWNTDQSCYAGDMALNERRLKNLVRFCEKFSLEVWVSGTKYQTVSSDDSELSDDPDSFRLDIVPTEQKVSELGAVGREILPPVNPELGYTEVILNEDTEVPFGGYQQWFDGTLFEQPRPEQKQVVPTVAKLLRQGYENIVLEMPTGAGKSALSMTIPKLFGDSKDPNNEGPNSYLLTHLKGLQAQYLSEMPFMKSVMGRGNYGCKLDVEAGERNQEVAEAAVQMSRAGIARKGKGCTADVAPCVTIKDFKCPYKNPSLQAGGFDWSVSPDSLCEYYGALTEAQNSDYFVANMAYAAALGMTPMLPEREFLVVDEAHNLPDVLVGAFSLDISERMLEKLVGVLSMPQILELSGTEQIREMEQRNLKMASWRPASSGGAGFGIPKVPSMTMDMSEDIITKCAAVWTAYLKELDGLIQKRIRQDAYAETKDLKLAMRVSQRIETIVAGLEHDLSNWIWQVSDERTFVSFKCVEIKEFADELLLHIGRRRIFMSATIGNPKMFCEELGLRPEATAFVRVAYSSFPLSNRPVYTRETGGLLTKKGQSDSDWNKTAEMIVEIMNRYPNQQGIILPYTDRIERELSERIADLAPSQMRRIIQHDKSAHGRDAAIDEWRTSRGGVIMSTYLNQGFDGKEAAFCIVVKLPYLSLGDVRTAKKMKANSAWYVQQTGIELAQMCGRAVRSSSDRGDTYILDPSFWYQYQNGVGLPLKDFLPTHLCESIEQNEGKTPLGMQQKFEIA
jgi:ATP-dependent DNA helicase DinG